MGNPTARQIFQLIDLTTLNATDSPKDVKALVDFALEQSQRGFSVAAICVHSNFAALLSEYMVNGTIKKAVVAGAFPHGQALIEVKNREIQLAVQSGVDEIDIVINRGMLLANELETLTEELLKMRTAAGSATLKTIIESGELPTTEHIKTASKIALNCGADFIKTSTGKSTIGATPDAVRAMCEEIWEFYKSTGEKRGIKVSGGVKCYQDAVKYYNIVGEILGKEWLNKDLFRIGASGLAKELLAL
jgi:deoxyribose-phosphate aldolase